MSNKTFIPAFQCTVGDWKYYICTMKYGEVARQVNFAYELSSNQELGQLIQRGIGDRTKGITEYLLKSEHRFLGGLVVAAWGGEPQYTQLSIDDPEGILQGLDRGFGVLTFDGTQAYFVLDGQHRLKAIKEAIKQSPDIGKEDICVLIVTHYDDAEGRLRTRRLFSNINRNAKQTATAENIALDEDDAIAVLTRRLLDEHDFLKEEGRVRVILGMSDEGGLRLATGSVPKTDAKAITTFTVLYDMLQYLSFDLPAAIRNHTVRPSDELLDEAFKVLSERLDDLFSACGDVRARLTATSSARELRSPKNNESNGHPFMRPVVQKAVARTMSEIIQQEFATWPVLMTRLSELDWKMGSAPWTSVFSIDGAKMLTGKDNTELLVELLHAHLAPASKQAIARARKKYKEVRGQAYPIAEEALAAQIIQNDTNRSSVAVVQVEEISDVPVIEIPMSDGTMSEDNTTSYLDDDSEAINGGDASA